MSDLISREVVIEALLNHYEVNNTVQNATMDECVMLVKSIPSAEPPPETCWGCNCPKMEEPKRGRWTPKEQREKQEIFICSECGGEAHSPWVGSRKSPKPNRCKYRYCPNCGARMEVTE